MSEYLVEDDLIEEPDNEVVHWMAPKPMSVGPGGLSAAVSAAFVLGAATAVGVLALMHWLGPRERD
jgi:hypothetical protein